jgi:hypothetical protein
MTEPRTELYDQEDVLNRLKGCEPLQALVGQQGFLASLIEDHGLESAPEKAELFINMDGPGNDPKL